jgi:hypothetical protein
MNLRKVIIGSFIGTLLAMFATSTYFYRVYRKIGSNLKSGFEKWDDLEKF